MKSEIENLTVVIRSVKERTESLCKKFIIDQGVDPADVHVIHEKPFSRAMEVSYKIGLQSGKKWTYCVDADVLLRKNSIVEMLTIANQQPETTFGISGRLLDKLFGNTRSVGNHLFRTSYLHLMLDAIADFNDETIRPESSAKSALKRKDLKWDKKKVIIGLHDFEQHYYDIARKTLTHSHKHTEQLSELITFWMLRCESDTDFKVALIGLAKGVSYFEDVKIDIDSFKVLNNQTEKKFGIKGVREDDFQVSSYRDIEDTLNNKNNFFEKNSKLDLKYNQIFVKKFYEKSYKDILVQFRKKITKDIKSL